MIIKTATNVSVDVRPGAHLLIMGNSGTGKSSMLRAIAGRLHDRWEEGVNHALESVEGGQHDDDDLRGAASPEKEKYS